MLIDLTFLLLSIMHDGTIIVPNEPSPPPPEVQVTPGGGCIDTGRC